MNKLLIITISLVVILTGCASGGSKSRVETRKTDVMSDKKEVYIGHFGITFITKDSGSSKSKSPMIRHTSASEYAKSVLTAKLTGVPQSRMQTITDKAYGNLVKDLEARGYKVLSYQDLQRKKAWSKLDKTGSPYTPSGIFDSDNRGRTIFSPTGMPLLFDETEIKYPYTLGSLAEDVGVPVLIASYTVHFAYFDKDADYTVNYFRDVPLSGGPSKELSASVTLGQGIQVLPKSSLHFVTEGAGSFSDNGYAWLEDPVIVAGAYGRNEDTTSDSTKAVNAFSSFVGLFTGGSTNKTEISVVANPDYYEFGVLKALDETNNRLANTLRPLPARKN